MHQKTSNYRYERKFVFENNSLSTIEYLIKSHPAFFREVYQQRTINNIYFDTSSFKNYFDNVYGNSKRIKIRMRWYGPMRPKTFEKAPPINLEFKLKSGLLGKKLTYKIDGQHFIKSFKRNDIIHALKQANISPLMKFKLKHFNPIILNHYKRKYFLSLDRRFRITLDWNINYFGFLMDKCNFIQKHEEKEHVVVEFKYDRKFDLHSRELSNYFPFILTKNSKYINSIKEIYGPIS